MKTIEAINMIKYRIETAAEIAGKGEDGKAFEDLEMAIKALEIITEMEKRNISTETILEYAKFEDECVQKGFTFKSLLEAREKQTPKEPIYEADGYADGELAYDYAECPICGHDFEYGINDWKNDYCSDCGQKLNWEAMNE